MLSMIKKSFFVFSWMEIMHVCMKPKSKQEKQVLSIQIVHVQVL